MNNNRVDDSYYYNVRPEMLAYLPTNARTVLDVGCGAGRFAALIKSGQSDCEVWGIEINSYAAESARFVLDKLLIGDICGLIDSLPEEYFDCIYFNDVLEHLYDPCDVLIKIKSKLKADGKVVASIPNVRHYKNLYNLIIKKQWIYEESGVMDFTHLRFFTELSLRAMFNKAGYQVEKLIGHGERRKLSKRIKIRVIGFLSFGYFSDIRYTQFACVATKKRHE